MSIDAIWAHQRDALSYYSFYTTIGAGNAAMTTSPSYGCIQSKTTDLIENRENQCLKEERPMAYEAVERWFRSRRYAQVNGACVRPVQHPLLKDIPLSIQKGQAESICLLGQDGGKWILKKFHKGRGLDRPYLMAVSSLLPELEEFKAGTQRQILSSQTLTRARLCYYSSDLAAFLDDTILMPQVIGIDWSELADEIRQGCVQLSRTRRIQLCRNLIDMVAALERNHCCHRDLSSGNVFIDVTTWKTYLIDFDSFFHVSLAMPRATTSGTMGYVPPFAWRIGVLDPKQTWCLYADRYALSILIVEFLILDTSSPLTAEGGMFKQDELSACSGPGLDAARRALMSQWPSVADLFDAAIHSPDCQSCPSPHDWQQALCGSLARAPKLQEVEYIPSDYFKVALSMATSSGRCWRPPALSEIPEFGLELPNL
jgi:serine/threonine protein kinase